MYEAHCGNRRYKKNAVNGRDRQRSAVGMRKVFDRNFNFVFERQKLKISKNKILSEVKYFLFLIAENNFVKFHLQNLTKIKFPKSKLQP